MKEELLAGRLNRFQCECGFEEFLTAHLRYVDDEKQFCVQLMPFEDMDDVLGQLTEDGEFRMDSELRNKLPKHIKDIRLVFAMDELARHVVLRDTLAAWHVQSKAKPFICFACGGPIRSGDSYYCISRLHQVKGNSDESQDDIVNAMATIQVCEGCKTKAVTRDITFPFLPVLPTLNLEKQGVPRFARWQALMGVEWKPVAKGRGSCSLCQAPIAIGDRYTRVDVTEEAQSSEDAVEAKESYTLAILCEEYRLKYMEWL